MKAGDLEGAWLHADYQEQLGPGQWPDHSMDATSPVYKTPVFISNLRDIKLTAISKELATQSLSYQFCHIPSRALYVMMHHYRPITFPVFNQPNATTMRQLSYMTNRTHVPRRPCFNWSYTKTSMIKG